LIDTKFITSNITVIAKLEVIYYTFCICAYALTTPNYCLINHLFGDKNKY